MIIVALPPELQATHGSTLTLSSSADATIASLKQRIESATGLGVESQAPFFGGSELVNEVQTLSEYGLESGSTVLLTAKIDRFHVVIAVPAALQPTFGPTISIAASESTTVAEIKAAALTALGVPESDLKLSRNGAELKSEDTLEASGIPNGGVIDASLTGADVPTQFTVRVALPPSLQSAYGETLTIATAAEETVDSLKDRIEQVTGITAAAQAVYFEGSALWSGQDSLGMLEVKDGSTVLLIDENRK